MLIRKENDYNAYIWQIITTRMKEKELIDDEIIKYFISPCHIFSISKSEAVIIAPSDVERNVLLAYKDTLIDVLKGIYVVNRDFILRVVCASQRWQ